MTEERLMVAQAVLDGLIENYHLTDAELDEVAALVATAEFERSMEEAFDRGCTVFGGFEQETVH